MPNHAFLKSCAVHNAVRGADITEWGIFPGPHTEKCQKFCLPLPHAAGMRQANASKKKSWQKKPQLAFLLPPMIRGGVGRVSLFHTAAETLTQFV